MINAENNPQPFQLDLFSWDKNAVGQGYEYPARFDFPAATACFSKVVKLLPDHADARRGLEVADFRSICVKHNWREMNS